MFDKQLPTFSLTVNDKIELIDPNEDLRICEGDLSTEFNEQAPKFAFYGGLFVDASVKLEELNNAIKKYEADHEEDVHNRVKQRYGKDRVTIAMIDGEFSRDEVWQKLEQARLSWKRTVLKLEMVKDAFKQRAQMLWQMGEKTRQEMRRMHGNDSTENSENRG